MRSCSLLQPACQPAHHDSLMAASHQRMSLNEACFTHSLTLQTKKTSALRRRGKQTCSHAAGRT
eukprot:scaffold14781_cov113-Isochrysis_galbana.AAC.4